MSLLFHLTKIPLPSPRRHPALLLPVAMLLLALLPVAAHPEERLEGSDYIRVTEEPWKVGEIRTYTLLFDQAPFGRETIRLEEMQGERDHRRLRFTQTLALDLRALGQNGAFLSYSTTRYERSKVAREYRAEDLLREQAGYSTYQKADSRNLQRLLSLDLAGHPPTMSWSQGKERGEAALPPPEGAALVDPLSMGHWERLFLLDTWRLGESKDLDLLLPRGSPRFDYHLDARSQPVPRPERIRITLRVEAREPVEVFSVPIPSFRCRIPELGYTLWVSGSGGILKFDDGRGLVASLER